METQGVQLLLLFLLCAVSTCWGQQVTCSDILLTISNGAITYAGGSTNNRPVGATGTYTCNTGYTLNGGTTNRTCGSDGMWSGSAPTCQRNCPELPSLANGMIMYSAGSTNNIPFLSNAVYSCNTGYTLTGGTLNGGTTRVCVGGGSWNGSPPTCQVDTGPTEPPTTCPDLTAPTNGMISYNIGSPNNRPIFSGATYSCNPGYTLTGRDTIRTCVSGGIWDGTPPTCQEIPCSDLPSLANGMITYSAGSRDDRLVGSAATHSCNNSYRLGGEAVRTCVSGDTWSGSAPVCQRPCSDLPPLMNGVITYIDGLADSRPINTIATFTCDNGYTLTGGSFRQCQNDGTWSGSALTCQLPPVYVSMGTTNYAVMNSQVAIDTIGDTTETALTCRTDSTICCTGQDNPNSANGLGEWLLPNGTAVTRSQDITDSDTDLLYSVGDTGALRLHRRGSVSGLTGSYCCVIPDNTGVIQAFCVQLVIVEVITTSPPITTSIDESSPCPPSNNTGAVVGGVVGLVAVVIAVTVVMVTYLVLRYKRGGKITVPRDIPLTDQGQSAAATYEIVPATYEEIPASKEVKGDYSYTQNNAYSTVSGREAPAAGGIYDN
ncbi:CUB and sushi domain-containing protein 3-like isoform X2 [Halichondria panicea]|uniref:CUB and sushi domain-containing protein 3-like isoform X2 n=1 Tax=Halichondria panicea TaxID=6063 RepID=UPI00312BC95C